MLAENKYELINTEIALVLKALRACEEIIGETEYQTLTGYSWK